MIPELIVELRQAREDWKRSGICYSRFITLAWEHLPAILDALEHQGAELKRIGEDRDYLNRANIANEWKDRFQTQAGQIERLKAALAGAEQRAKQEYRIANILREDIAALIQERDALERRRLRFATEKIHALDEQRKHLDSSWAKFYQLDASAEGRVTALMQERDAAIARAEHWRKMHWDQGNLLDSAIKRAEKAERPKGNK